jgi:hypothetical protein
MKQILCLGILVLFLLSSRKSNDQLTKSTSPLKSEKQDMDLEKFYCGDLKGKIENNLRDYYKFERENGIKCAVVNQGGVMRDEQGDHPLYQCFYCIPKTSS